MDYFEGILATLLRADGYWVHPSYKVNLTTEDKRKIRKPSMPRPEIDLLAFKSSENRVIALEAKSYFDSGGVPLSQLQEEHDVPEGRYKLFTSERYRKIVFEKLLEQLTAAGMASSSTQIKLGLAAGNVYGNQSDQISAFMQAKGWLFFSPENIKEKVEDLARMGYENDPAIITAKILQRK